MMTQKQINEVANHIKKCGMPDAQNQWLGMTPKALAANQAARERLTIELKQGRTNMSIGPKEQALRESRLTEADKKHIAELASGQAQKKAASTANRIAKMKAKKSGDAAKMPAQGKDALKVIDALVTDVTKAITKKKPTKAQKLADASVTEISWSEMVGDDLRKAPPAPKKKLPETTAPLADLSAKELKKHAPKAKNGKAKPMNLTQKAREACMSKKGATREELMKLTGWKAINIKKLVPKGSKLRQENDHFRIV